ncbi:MAG: aspartate carbamoyltransferase [Candidatus Helarchaeota archaeon]
MKDKHLISIKNLNRKEIEHILNTADKMEILLEKGTDIAKNKILASLFYEPSTRTQLSFSSAMLRLGGNVIGFSDPELSSKAKGENLADTIRCVENYCDLIVLRHSLEGADLLASEISSVPIVSAGCGTKEHPTQALLDLLTIKREVGKLDDIKVGILGDLKYGRTVKSFTYALSLFNCDLNFISPPTLKINKEVLNYLEDNQISYSEFEDVMEIINDLDVLYVTRIQKERFPDPTEYLKVKGSYKIDLNTVKNVKESFIIMHPLPRIDEISYEIDNTKFAKYFKQTYYGLLTRMSIISLILNLID